jgi:hypothetical protein
MLHAPPGRSSRLGIRSALAAMVLVGAALLPASAAASDSLTPNAASSQNCWVSTIGGPYKIGGPAVQATGSGACNYSYLHLIIHVRIEMWQNGVWNQVATADPVCANCSSISAVATSGVCAGTKQYFAQVEVQWTSNDLTWYNTGWTYSTVRWITC